MNPGHPLFVRVVRHPPPKLRFVKIGVNSVLEERLGIERVEQEALVRDPKGMALRMDERREQIIRVNVEPRRKKWKVGTTVRVARIVRKSRIASVCLGTPSGSLRGAGKIDSGK